jgi:hypothetical protein
MVSLLKILPRASTKVSYEAVIRGDVYRAEDGSYGSVTSRPGETVITGQITQSESDHKFLVRHQGPLQVQTNGKVTTQVEEGVEALSATSPGGPSFKGKPPAAAPSFGIPGESSVPNERVKRGMPFADMLLADKTAVRNSRVGGILQWQANQKPGEMLPVKAVLSASNPDRPFSQIKSALNTKDLRRTGETRATFLIRGTDAELLSQIDGASYFLEGTNLAASTGVPVGGGAGSGMPGQGPSGGGGPTSGSGGNDSTGDSRRSDRIIQGVPDAMLGAGIFVFGVGAVIYSSGGSGSEG